jgi:hypothetical protein
VIPGVATVIMTVTRKEVDTVEMRDGDPARTMIGEETAVGHLQMTIEAGT